MRFILSSILGWAFNWFLGRLAAYLWEQFTGHELVDLPNAVGPYVDLFDAKKYLTGRRRRNTRWRVNFNGPGDIWYCPSIERTSAITALQENDTLSRAQVFPGRDQLSGSGRAVSPPAELAALPRPWRAGHHLLAARAVLGA